MKRIKLLQLLGKENRRSLFIRRIKEKDLTTEMKEDQITGSKENQIEEDKTEDLILKGSNALVVKDTVT